MLLLAAVWTVCNFYLWSMKQSQAMLFIQSRIHRFIGT
jgi:hypothetical protein